MKRGWTYKKLGEVCEILNGFAFKSNQYVPDGIRVIRITNVQKGYVEDKEPKYYPTKTKDELKKYLLKENDLLISLTGNVGRVGIIDKELIPAYLNQRVGCLRIKKNDLFIPFLFYFLNSNNFENDCIKSSTGVAQKNMSTIWLSEYVVPTPPLTEQKIIVKRLDAAFAQIDELKANAEKQLAEARALFQKSLAKAMEPKEGWEKKKLKDIAQVRIGPFGSLLHKKDYITGGIPLVNPIHMIGGRIVKNNDFTISNEKASELLNYLLKENDVVFARRGEVGRCAIVSKDEEGFLCGTGSLFVRFKTKVNCRFMLMLFQSGNCKEYLDSNASGATMLNINAGIVENMPIVLPSFSEQQRIVERLDSISENIRKYEDIQRKIIAECDALKQALLRQVFE